MAKHVSQKGGEMGLHEHESEYKVEDGDEAEAAKLQAELNAAGSKGWELITIYGNVPIFERAKRTEIL